MVRSLSQLVHQSNRGTILNTNALDEIVAMPNLHLVPDHDERAFHPFLNSAGQSRGALR